MAATLGAGLPDTHGRDAPKHHGGRLTNDNVLSIKRELSDDHFGGFTYLQARMMVCLFNRRGARQCVGVTLCLLGAICTGSEQAVAFDETYLVCNGSITVHSYELTTVDKQEIAVHISGDRISFSGNAYLGGTNIEICEPNADYPSRDEPRFDSQSCTSNTVDLSRPRQYGTFNTITGKLVLSNEEPQPQSRAYFVPPLTQGQFVCRKKEPLVK